MLRAHLAAIALGVAPLTLSAQALERQIATMDSGTVRLSFAGHPGVCGKGVAQIDPQPHPDEWEPDCHNRTVRVALNVRQGKVVAIRTYVGGRWRAGLSGTDLGIVRSKEAAAYFLTLSGQRDLSGDPVLPATLADSVTIWPSLIRLARAQHLPHERRRTAIFWLSRAAGATVTSALDSIAFDDGDREIRKQAVFALSQRSGDESVAALIRIVRTHRDPEIKRTALFWLGQSEDPRAIDLFEELLQ